MTSQISIAIASIRRPMAPHVRWSWCCSRREDLPAPPFDLLLPRVGASISADEIGRVPYTQPQLAPKRVCSDSRRQR
jgi:hypothetical protein